MVGHACPDPLDEEGSGFRSIELWPKVGDVLKG